MYNDTALRTALTSRISAAAQGYPVCFDMEKTGAARFVVCAINDLPEIDGRSQAELEVDIVGPLSDADGVSAVRSAIVSALDRAVIIQDAVGFYLYRSTMNRVDGSAPHTIRHRVTFDLYIYERN